MNSKLEKFIDKPFQHLHPQSKYAVLISSSKGNYIKPHRDILRAIHYKLRFVCRGGSTNVIRLFSDLGQSNIQVPEAWKMAFTCLNIDNSVPVRTTNKYPICLGLNEVKTIHGLVKTQVRSKKL